MIFALPPGVPRKKKNIAINALVGGWADCYYTVVQYSMDEKKPTRKSQLLFKTAAHIEL